MFLTGEKGLVEDIGAWVFTARDLGMMVDDEDSRLDVGGVEGRNEEPGLVGVDFETFEACLDNFL